MSPFGIFTIVLISLYVVYYAILITKDIYGKKNTAKNEEEEFDISSLQEEEATVGVEESDNGFSLTPLQKKGKTEPAPFPVSSVPAATDGASSGGAGNTVPAGFDSGATPFVGHLSPETVAASKGDVAPGVDGESATQEKIGKVQEEMDEIDPIGNLTMSKEFFRDLLLQANKEGSLFVQKKHVPAV